MIPLALGLREDGAARPERPLRSRRKAARMRCRKHFARTASGCSPIGFFVCGFHVTFIGLHLPAYIADKSIGMSFFGTPISPIELGGWAIGLVGLFNIFGSLLWGWLGGHLSAQGHAGAALCLACAGVCAVSALPLSWISVLVFSASLGFLWLGTVPLTSGLVGYMFGPAHMSMLWGIVFFSHQLGSFLGGWGAGRLYDIQGNYDLMWLIAVGLGLLAAVIHWLIREQPVERLQMKVAPA